MKKSFIPLLFMMVVSAAVTAQTKTLSYSAVITLAGNNITTSPYTIATVPAGKVWKVEHMAGIRNNISYGFPAFTFNINGIELSQSMFYSGYGTSGNITMFSHLPSGPIWLKPGDIIKIYDGSASYPVTYFISIIEFVEVVAP